MVPDLTLAGELYRKAFHLLALLLPLAVIIVGGRTAFWYLLATLVVAVSADIFRVRSHGFNRFIDRYFGWTMRSHERPRVGEKTSINGATWVLASLTLLLFVFDSSIAVISFSLFMVGDAAAAIVGRRFGERKWGGRGCTIEGSAAFFIAGLVTALLIGADFLPWPTLGFPILALILAAAASCVAEVASVPVNDNLFSPFVGAVTLAVSVYILSGLPVVYFPLF